MAYPDYKFVGLHQYIKMFTADPILPIALRNLSLIHISMCIRDRPHAGGRALRR